MLKDLIIYTPMYVTLFWSIVLFFSGKNKAKKYLSVFMIFAFLVYVSHAFFFKQIDEAYLVFDSVYILASLSVYPMYYWYIKILTVETSFKVKNIRMLIPSFVLALMAVTVYILMRNDEKYNYLHYYLLQKEIGVIDSNLIKVQRIIFIASRVIFALQVVSYLVLGQKLVVKYNERIANFYSNLESKTIVWVKLLLYSFVLTSAMSLIFNIIGRGQFLESSLLLLIPSIIFSVLLFFIGFQGYMQNHTVTDLEKDEKLPSEVKLKDYNKAQLKDQLLVLFEEHKIYRNSELKITQISSRLQTNRTYISNIINSEFVCSFSEFVNGYRIEEAKKMLLDNSFFSYSMNYISEAVGFGSLNTFIRVFKESEGITPGKFREKYKKNILEEDKL